VAIIGRPDLIIRAMHNEIGHVFSVII